MNSDEVDLLKRPQISFGLFMELSKAFDVVNHENHLQKLEKYGLRGHVNDLIKSYLINGQ